MKRERALTWTRRAVLLAAASSALYLWSRFDWIQLPEAGCSPVYEVAPGAGLLVDRRPSRLGPGDLLLYHGPDGHLLLGRVEGLLDDGFDVRGDREDCPSPDSESLGPIAPSAVEARVLFAFHP